MGGRGSGRQPYQPTEKDRGRVEALAGYGFTEEQICTDLGITAKTLRKHFRAELDTAALKANALVAQSLFKKAMGDGTGAVAACIFWLKCRCRWRDVNDYEPAVPQLGKKEQAAIEARAADFSTDIGQLIAERQGLRPN
jgi:AraC-like DNA-binding protein